MDPFRQLAQELPDGKMWITGKFLKRLLGILSADRVRPGTNVQEYSTGQGRFFNGSAGGDIATASKHPWQPYLSPFLGTGNLPDDQGRRIKVRKGWVQDSSQQVLFPARLNIEILVPPNCIDGYHVWLVASMAPDGTMTALDYAHGAAPPGRAPAGDSTTGAIPAEAYYELFYVTSDATSITDLSNTFASTPLQIGVSATATGNLLTKRLVWTPTPPAYAANP